VRTFITIAVTVVVTLGIAGGIGVHLSRKARRKSAPPTVWVQPPSGQDLVEIVSAPATVAPRAKVAISARVSARVRELPFRCGQVVTKGDPSANPPVPPSVLVRLDDTDLQAVLRSARARFAAQQAQIEATRAELAGRAQRIVSSEYSLADAQRKLERQVRLRESHDVSESALEEAQTHFSELSASLEADRQSLLAEQHGLTVQTHQLEAAQAEIDRAEDNLSYTTILSPINGVVTQIKAEVGEMAITGTMNNPGTMILEVADLGEMLALAEVEEADVPRISPAQAAKIHVRGYDEPFGGTVDSVALVSTVSRDGTKHYEVRIVLDTKGRHVFTGLSANVEIQTRRHQGLLKVPSQAILGRKIEDLPGPLQQDPNIDRERSATPVVFRCIGGKAMVTPIKPGPSDATHTIILAGLAPDDRVVVGPYKVLDKLADGRAVSAEDPPTPTSAPSSSPAASQPAESQPARDESLAGLSPDPGGPPSASTAPGQSVR